MFAAAQGMSFKDESAAPFTELVDTIHSSGIYTVPDSNCYRNNQYYLSGAEVYDIYDESVRDEIKQKIMEYGAGQTSYIQNEGSLDYSTFAYYTAPEVTTEPSGGHAVAVVGWDDEYSVDNFRYAPEKPGAWLITNSWGEDWGLDGYFWMSYYEPTLEFDNIFFYDLEETGSFDNIYQYDGSLLYDYIMGDSGIMTTANVFTAQQNETLNAVSFFTAEDDVDTKIFIYKDIEEGNPSSGTLVYSDDSYAKHMGYTKFDIPADKTVKLKKGDTFSIVLEQTVRNNSTPAAFLFDGDQEWSWIGFKNSAEPGQSFYSKSSDWPNEDWTDASEEGINLRIKAFTTVDDTAADSEIFFDKIEYEVILGETAEADVQQDGKSIKESAKLSFESADENVAFVTDMGKIYGRKLGNTEITVKCGEKSKTAQVKVINDPAYDSILIKKADHYATEDKPIEVKLGSIVAPEFTTLPSVYSGKEKFKVEALDGSLNKYAYEITNRGTFKFYKAGKYKVTVTVDRDDNLNGGSQEFYINAVIDSKDCSENVTAISENPYECEATKIYRYNGNGSGYSFKMNYDIEKDCDYMYVFGTNESDISDQEIYDFFRSESAKLRNDNYDVADEDYDEDEVILVDTLNGKQSDYTLKVPYKYAAFVMYTDQYLVGSYEVLSVDTYSPVNADSISMNSSDMIPSVKVGDKADYQIIVAPAEAANVSLYCDSENQKIAAAKYDEKTGKLSITGNKVGTTDIYLYIDKKDKKDAKSAEDAVDGTVTGRALRIKANVITETNIPDSFAFETSELDIERNTTKQVKFNSDEWLNYDIEYDNPEPNICYINKGEIVAVATGTTKIKATVDAGLGEANPTAELTVTVKAPETDSINNLQTIHNIVPGMDETYTYKAPEGTECMKIYFDGRTSFRDSDGVIIKDGNGYYYGLDSNDRVITTKDNVDEAIVSDNAEDYYDYFLLPNKMTDYAYVIYDDEVSIRFISFDSLDNNSDADDIYRSDSYGFKVRKIENGKAATGIEIENSDINLDFSTYNSNSTKIKTKLIPEDAIDNICYDVDDASIAKIDRYGAIKGLREGETEFRVYTSNPNVETPVSVKGKVEVKAKEIKSIVFMDDEGNECEKDKATDIFVSPGEESCFYIKIDPWNMRKAYSFDYDRSSFLVYEAVSDIGSKFHFVAPDTEGIYPLDVKMSVKNSEGVFEEQIIHTYNINVQYGPDDVPDGFETFKVKKFKNDANDDKEPEEITADDIKLSNIPGNKGYFTYKKPGADYVEITFTDDSEIGAGDDWIFIYNLKGELVGAYTGDNTVVSEYGYAGKTIRIEGEGFILGYKGDNSGMYNGFKVDSINAHVPSNENSGEGDKPVVNPTEKPTVTPTEKPDVPVTPSKSNKKAPKVGSVVKVGKTKYKILSKTAVAYAGTTVKNPKSVTIPATVKISGKKYKVTAINANALKNKKALKKLVIGSNVQKIGKNAFYGCKNLKTIIIKSSVLKKVEPNAIKNIYKNAVIKVPTKKLKAYTKLFTAKTGYKKKTMKVKK